MDSINQNNIFVLLVNPNLIKYYEFNFYIHISKYTSDIILLFNNNQCIGYLSLSQQFNQDILESLYIDKPFRDKKYGTFLLSFCIKYKKILITSVQDRKS